MWQFAAKKECRSPPEHQRYDRNIDNDSMHVHTEWPCCCCRADKAPRPTKAGSSYLLGAHVLPHEQNCFKMMNRGVRKVGTKALPLGKEHRRFGQRDVHDAVDGTLQP
eukprot:m.1127759 g.1127759  ORF g.1127759 m.1127759 type:complete len:108 (+) comp24412_c0_seq139:1174-1497(+)